MRSDELIWKAVDRRRAEFISWARREFSVALRRQFDQWDKATGGSLLEADMMRAVESMKEEPIAEALEKVYLKVAGTFAVEAERSLTKRKQAKQFGATDRTESAYHDQILAWLRSDGMGAEKVVGMDETSKRTMRRIIQQSFELGLSVEDTNRAIRAKWRDMSKVRAERIARTEVVGASNMGAMAGAKATGLLLMKQWISTQDDRTRRAPYDHLDANLTTVEMDGMFVIGGDKISFPGDPAGQPGNIINCRCTVVFVEKEPETSPVIQPAPEPVVDNFTLGFSAKVGDAQKFEQEYGGLIRETLRDLKIAGRIDFVLDKLDASTGGHVTWVADPVKAGQYTMGRQVTVNVLNTKQYTERVIRHELRHVWQGTAGSDKARIKLNPSDGRMWIYWDNMPYITVQQFNNIVKNISRGKNYQRYLDFPWESDARAYEVKP